MYNEDDYEEARFLMLRGTLNLIGITSHKPGDAEYNELKLQIRMDIISAGKILNKLNKLDDKDIWSCVPKPYHNIVHRLWEHIN